MLNYTPTRRAEAIVAMNTNKRQLKLVADTPSIITCLVVLFDNEIGSNSTRKYVDSCMAGYNQYGRLHENQLPVIKNIILQYSKEIFEVLDSQQNSEESNVEVKKQEASEDDREVETGHDPETELDEVDPFA